MYARSRSSALSGYYFSLSSGRVPEAAARVYTSNRNIIPTGFEIRATTILGTLRIGKRDTDVAGGISNLRPKSFGRAVMSYVFLLVIIFQSRYCVRR